MLKSTAFNRIMLSIAAMLLIMVLLGGCSGGGSTVVPPVSLKVMTYNIHHGAGTDGKLDLGRIAEVIDSAECDIVGLQEVDNNFGSRSDFVDQAKWLAEELNMHYVFAPAIDNQAGQKPQQYGNAILSRYPIIKSNVHKLPTPAGYEPRVCLEAKVQIETRDYIFMVTHLDHRSNAVRNQQVAEILKVIPHPPERTVLMGDFNAQPSDEPVAGVLEKFQDSFVISGASKPQVDKGQRRIDYIFVSPDLSGGVKSCSVIRNDSTAVASDHLPVVMEMRELF